MIKWPVVASVLLPLASLLGWLLLSPRRYTSITHYHLVQSHKFTTKLTMYGTIPDVVISKPPRNNQLRVVVALASAFLIGALGRPC